MPQQRKDKGGRLRMIYLLLAAGSLVSGGCLAVAAGGIAGAGAATYIYFKGKVCQDYPSSFSDAWAAVQKALQDEGFPLVSNENDGKSGKITTRTTDGTTITVDLEVIPSRIPAEGSLTRVCVRVGLLGDQPLSERLLSRINSHLAPPGTPIPVPTAGAPGPGWTPAGGPGPIRPVAAGPPETPEPPGVMPRDPAPVKP